jgi:hypothetical protein
VAKLVLGGILLYHSAIFVYEWLIDSVSRISLTEYASLLAIGGSSSSSASLSAC